VVDNCLGNEGPLSFPKGPFSVGLDGGYVRDWEQKQRHFEVIVGKAVPPNQSAKCFGFVQSYDTNPLIAPDSTRGSWEIDERVKLARGSTVRSRGKSPKEHMLSGKAHWK
jgi:hypothetical protein